MRTTISLTLAVSVYAAITMKVIADDAAPVVPAVDDIPAASSASPVVDVVPLNPQKTVLLDNKRKRLLVKAKVVQREALLEMFLCKSGTKEHESIVSVDSEAYVIHAGLLAIGASPGTPVTYSPEYKPPTGHKLDIFVSWIDETGRPHRRPAQEWVRRVTRRYYVQPLDRMPNDYTKPEDSELRFDAKRKEIIWFGPMSESQRDEHLTLSENAEYRTAIGQFFKASQPREMEADFLFAGSGFHVAGDGTKHYMAESGNLICVANFSDAIIDVAAKSTASNDELLFEPYTERIPPQGTEVTIELVPREEKTTKPPSASSEAEMTKPSRPQGPRKD